jgi:hypothetical protein
MRKSISELSFFLAFTAILALGCSSDSGKKGAEGGGAGTVSAGANSGGDTGSDAGADSGGNAGASVGGTGGSSLGGSSLGGSGGVSGTSTGITACANGLDDDADGLTDGFDPECTGAADNDEGSFATGIPGDNRDNTWQDCFFDGNSGAGDDDCRYHIECLTKPTTTTQSCTLTTACLDFCAPLTPNGCDCFGCCSVQLNDGTTVNVLTDATCSLDNISSCRTCSPSTACGNTCGTCELCAGKTVEDLPTSCGTYSCEGGAQVCGSEGMATCPGGFYCMMGCCTLALS